MELVFQWLALALAVAVGWVMGRWGVGNSRRAGRIADEATVRERLQFLFTNYSDEAIDAFVGSLAVSRDTVNLHLSVGAHFRNKGEVDRAILIHQNLLARPELPPRYSSEVTFELAVDYRAAGLHDRAEALLLQVVACRHYGPKAARQLIDLYQQERDWEKARQTAIDLMQIENSPKLGKQLAYILCELAEQAAVLDDRFAARQHLREALMRDHTCVRASLQLAALQHREQQYREARASLVRVFEQNPNFAPEAVERLLEYGREENNQASLARQLRKLYSQAPGTSLLLALVDCVEKAEGRPAAIALLRAELEKRPSLKGLLRLIHLAGRDERAPGDDSRLISHIGELLLHNKPVYRCIKCGFGGQHLHWLCPSCKTWETVLPIQGVEGE
ncbi:lipopolysaccharide assembly protein LapB [Hydrocarboniclastica marina]|uniref:Lipopolysaccharide assembly protein B n=1 Tax=Hydrocarboniclastica marina TaxID=2259620 RepID=A0A4P7XFJ2_9ALTE|nr:lipopolysaccharide assembly protein LapB [Hydrocarboniclastica marina]QCF25739.1 lipopolysaccharide assembly protein LapB [Hydrocarboniclastica marina]